MNLMEKYFRNFGLILLASSAASVIYSPTPYIQQSDSPFLVANGSSFILGSSNFFLDDFEDHALNTLGVSEISGKYVWCLSGPPYADSVDEDDGVVDGSGIYGTSLISEYHWGLSEPSLVFSFDPIALGGLPTHAGFVVTGLNGDRVLEFSAFDASNSLISFFQFQLFFSLMARLVKIASLV
jgi:hypothetical protein